MQSVERCGRTGVVVAGLVCCLVTGVAVPAVAMRDRLGPSREEVARARSKAVERSKQLGETRALLVRARTTLGRLSGEARKLVEVYNRERIKAARAEELLRKARDPIVAAGAAGARQAVTLPVQGGGIAAIPFQPGDRASVIPVQAAGTASLQDGEMAVTPFQESGEAAMSPVQTAVGVVPPQAASVSAQSAVSDLQARLLQAEIAYGAQREAVERAAAARKAAEEAVAGQTAEIERIVAEKARLKRQTRADTSTADRIVARRQAVRKWSKAARQRARLGKRRSAAVARKRARFVAARGETGSVRPLHATWQAARGDIAADWALTQLDKPYVWAATGPLGYDCSGLTMQAWARAGVRIDHWTGTQWTSGQHVQITRLRRGDLLFFGTGARSPGDISHVGIYIGRGLMVHAPQTGDVVRVAPIWRGDLVGATRPV
ncbi:cell wall-associated NlpC family hydrolase [Streptosporangium album]|uniref:Cell wall-associated NlpC family hydrolase n=1 Tax=Streptosporangium album TaxID=47479 RepID=A0A7W7RU69_9ACTN|nr:C40 family peptidase [Streptosporangium album]MBB4938271.1 cell wall-associated NlpC family hydrolase [Streptosporangium album]